MHNENLDLLRKEAIRLVDLESKVLDEVVNVPKLVDENYLDSKKASLGNKDKINREKEVLKGEKNKLTEMEMVVAVVGTMKAGKSTTINAIVGAEVLPNRNGPMTAIPTLIRHKKGQKEPVIHFDNNGPANRLIESLSAILSKDRGLAEVIKSRSPDLQDAVNFIERKEQVETRYSGQDGIFCLLKVINDLVRMCSELGVEFPFVDYDEIHELPVIEVEFSSLSASEAGLGKITLLDTPGPNEAGQDHLKVMLDDQLKKASAVIAVLNYTNLKSNADHELRGKINEIAKVAKGRLYAFVNRYDERSRQDPGKEKIVSMVSNNLMQGEISEEYVFPVSAKRAYLSDKARREVLSKNVLPNHEDNDWVCEFADLAFGFDQWDEDDIIDGDDILSRANKLWRKSGFEAPLERVIKMAYKNAAIYALDSSASKLAALAEDINNFLSGRGGALKKGVEQLRSYIEDLESDIRKVEGFRDEADRKMDGIFSEMKNGLNGEVENSRKTLKDKASALFDSYYDQKSQMQSKADDKSLSPEERRRAAESAVSSMQKSIAPAFFKDRRSDGGAQKRNDSHFGDKMVVEFPNQEEAKAFLGAIHNQFSGSISGLANRLNKNLDGTLSLFSEKVTKDVIEEAAALLKQVSGRLGENGIELRFTVPTNLEVAISGVRTDVMLNQIAAETKQVTRLRDDEKIFGRTRRFLGGLFGTDWGKEEYEEDVPVFKVRKLELQKSLDRLIDDQGQIWRREVVDLVERPAQKAIADFFQKLSLKIEAVREDLLAGIEDNQRSKEEQAKLLKEIARIVDGMEGVNEDALSLSKDAKGLCENINI